MTQPRGLWYTLVILMGLVATACGGSSAESSRALRSWTPSQTLPPLPPDTSGTISGDANFRSAELDPNASHSEEILFHLDEYNTDVHMHVHATMKGYVLTTGLASVHSMGVVHTSGGSLVLLVGGEGSQGEIIQVYKDSDADGIIKTADLVATVSEGTPPSGGALYGWIADADGDVLVYDRRNHRVLRLEDSNSDGVVDSFSSNLVMDSTHTHAIRWTTAISWDSSENCILFHESSDVTPDELQDVVRGRDVNGDGVVDEISTTTAVPEEDLDVVGFAGPLEAGDLVVLARGRQNATIQLWQVDAATGADVALIGTVVHGAGQTLSSLSLNTALVADEVYRLKDITHSLDGDAVKVVASLGVVIISVTPSVVDSTGGTLVEIKGRGFTSDLELDAFARCGTSQSRHEDLSYNLVSSEEITVVIPALSVPDSGVGLLTLWDGTKMAASTQISWAKP